MSDPRPSVAVIGAGVAGLTAAYLLQRGYDVTLFDAEDRLGGHAHTHDVLTSSGSLVAVDSGFLVGNRTTYPSLVRLLTELDIDLQPAPMGLSVRCDGCGLEYAGGRGLRGLFADRSLTARPRFWRLLDEIRRFYRTARRTLETGADDLTLDGFVRTGGFSPYFRRHFLIPVVSAVWSTGPALIGEYPARYLFRFLANHGMLSASGSLPWFTVPGGSRRYVERAAKHLTAVYPASPVRAVTRHPDHVEVRDESDRVARFDRVVVATHADTALGLLGDASPAETAVLGRFDYSANEAVLHHDERLLPRRVDARVSWNYYLPACRSDGERAMVTYDVTRLQSLPGPDRQLVSLNPGPAVDERRIVTRMSYTHPIYTPASVAAQSGLAALNRDRTAFAGSYHGWGFHEDGCRAGAVAAASFGVPW